MFPRGHIHPLNITDVNAKYAAAVRNYGSQLKTDNPVCEVVREFGHVDSDAYQSVKTPSKLLFAICHSKRNEMNQQYLKRLSTFFI